MGFAVCIDKACCGPYLLPIPEPWRNGMFELTDTAHKELESYFADKERTPIRVYLAPGG
jgi:hypothetical protein